MTDKSTPQPSEPGRSEIHERLTSKLKETQRFETDARGTVRIAGEQRRSMIADLFASDLFKRIRRADIIMFSRQIAMMIEIGIPVIQALHILSLRTPNHKLRTVIADIGAKVETGASLSEAIGSYPSLFNEFYINTIKAGEESGTADESFKLLADYMEKENRIIQKFKSALTYPIVTLLAAIVVGMILFIKVIPVFEKVYADAKIELPLPTVILMSVASFVKDYYYLIIAVVISLFILSRFMRLSPGIQATIDYIKLKFPRLGTIMTTIIIYRFAKLMSIMLRSGVPIHQAMKIAADAVGNRITEQALQRSTALINEGFSIEESLRKTEAFRPIDVDIIGVGEQTGSVDVILGQLATAYEEELETVMANISVLIEPLMLLIIGGFVALIALSLFLPYLTIGPAILPHY